MTTVFWSIFFSFPFFLSFLLFGYSNCWTGWLSSYSFWPVDGIHSVETFGFILFAEITHDGDGRDNLAPSWRQIFHQLLCVDEFSFLYFTWLDCLFCEQLDCFVFRRSIEPVKIRKKVITDDSGVGDCYQTLVLLLRFFSKPSLRFQHYFSISFSLASSIDNRHLLANSFLKSMSISAIEFRPPGKIILIQNCRPEIPVLPAL